MTVPNGRLEILKTANEPKRFPNHFIFLGTNSSFFGFICARVCHVTNNGQTPVCASAPGHGPGAAITAG